MTTFLVVATWALVLATTWMAYETRNTAKATAESMHRTAESIGRTVLLQELAALAPIADYERKLGPNLNAPDIWEPRPATKRVDAIIAELGISETPNAKPADEMDDPGATADS